MKKLRARFAALPAPLRRTLPALGIVAVCLALLWGGMTILKTAGRKPVNVYLVADFAQSDYWGNTSQTSGIITTDRLQKIFISDTQTVRQVFVTEGQTVSKGTKLMSYDTTLSELDVKRAQISVERQEIALKTAQEELDRLENVKTEDELKAIKADLEKKIRAEQERLEKENPDALPALPALPYGKGTKDAPRYIRGDSNYITYSQTEGTYLHIDQLSGLLEASPTDLTETYVVLVRVEGSGLDQLYTEYTGLHLKKVGSALQYAAFDAAPLEKSALKQPGYELLMLQRELAAVEELLLTPLSYRDILQMQSDMQKQLEENKLLLQLAKAELQKKERELNDGAIYAEIDGTVLAIRDPAQAYQNGEAVVELSGGGGYYIEGSVGELELGKVKIGQTVTLNDYMTGAMAEGEVVEIGTYPLTDGYHYGGNSNSSLYPMKIFVSAEASLQAGNWVDISYSTASEEDAEAWYLENMFLRSEKGRTYVLAQDAEGRLEKRFVRTGGDLWGSYTQIRGGLTMDDRVAFPYGKDAVVGAKTVEATIEELYQGY